MADTIKEYVIKIRADVEEAQKSIDKLQGAFKNVNIKNSVNVDFGNLADKINGHIGKITQGIGELQSSFKDISTKDISSELKDLLTTLNNTINGLKDSFSGFNKIFNSQEGSDTTGFQHVFDDLKKQLSDMLTSYNDTMETMKKIMSGEVKITPVETGIGAVADNLANEVDGAKQKLGAAQSELETAVSSFLKARDKILKSVGNDKKKYNVNDYNDFTKVLDVLINQAQSFASMGGNLSSTGFSKISETIDGLIELKDQLSQARLDKAGRDLNTAVTKYLDNVEMIIKSVSDSGQGHYSSSDYRSFENMITQLMNQAQAYIDLGGSLDDTKFKKTSETLQSLAKLRAQVVRQYEALTQNTSGQKMLENRRSNRQKNNEVSKIVLPISVEIDESQMSEESIDELVSKIQTNIQNKVQKKLAKNPVKMPLAFSSAISTEGLDEKTAKDVASEFEGSTEEATKGLIKDIQIQVKADTDRLVKEINSKIQQINTSDALAKIQVDVVPKSIDQAGVDQFAQQVETQIRDNLDLEGIEGIPVSGNFNVNTTGLATESTLSEILSILSGFRGKGILINHDNDNTPPSGGGTPPRGVGGGTHIPPHNNPPVGGNIPPKDSGGNAQIPHNNPLDGGSGGSKSAVHGAQGQRSDGPIPVEQVGVVKTEPAKSSVQNVKVQQNPQEQKKPTTKDYFRYTGFSTWHKGATKDYNETASLRKDTYYALQGTRQQQKGLDTLFSFLTRKTSTLEELKDSEVYKSKYVIDKQDYALFGGDRQTLGDFQTFLTTTFEKGKKDIEDGLGEIAKDFSEEALEEKVSFRGSSETLATKREELEKQNGKLNDLLTKEANLKALVGNPKAEINGKTGEEAQIDIQNAILNVQDRIARKKEDIGKLENDLEAYLKAHPEVPKWKDLIGEQLEKERERALKPAAIQKLVSQGKYKSNAEAETGVQKDFSDRRSSLLSSSSRTPLYDEQLKGIRTKKEADKRKEIADDLLKQSRTQVKGRVKALAENLSLLGAATTDKGELKVNWDDFASNPDQVMLEIRNGLQKIRDEGDKEIKFYADSINGIKDSSEDLKRYIELGSKTRTDDEEAEFSSLQERLKPILSKGAYFAKFSQEISDATSEANRIYEEIAKTGSSSDQDRLPDLERIINGDNAIKETFSAQELVQAAQTSLDKVAEAEAEITKIQKRVRSRQYDFVNRTGEFSAYDDTTKMRKASPIAVSMNRQTYGAQKALLPKWEKVISEMQVRMLPKEGGGFDTSSLTKPEQQLYYRAMTNVRKLRGGIEAYELINQITHNKPNGGTPIYKSLGLDERASKTLFNLPTAQEIKGMNSEQLIQLSKDIQYAIDALQQKQSGELTDQEIQEKAIEQANADIIALDERIKQITAQLEKIGDPGNDRVKARKKRQLEYELEDTKKSKAQLTENEELGVAVRDTDGKWKRIKFSDYQKEKEALDIEDAKIDDDILKALGVKIGKPEVLSEFKRDLLALQVLMENEAEARETYQMARNDAHIKYLNKPYTRDQVDRAKRIMYGDQAEDVPWSQIDRDLSKDRQALTTDSRWAIDVLKGFRKYETEKISLAVASESKKEDYEIARNYTKDMWKQISSKYGLKGSSFKSLFGEKAYQTTYSISEDAIDQEMDDVIRQNEENVKNGINKKATTILDKLKKSQIQKIGQLAEVIFTAEGRIERTQDLIDQYNVNKRKADNENNKVYRKKSIRGYKNPEDFVRYNSELPATNYANAQKLYGVAMPEYINKQRGKIADAMQQLRGILPKDVSDEDISRILSSILVSYQPKGKVAKLMERSQRVQEQRNAMEELKSKAEKRGLNGKGVYDERVGVYTERMKGNQKQATDTLNSLSETQRIVQQQLPITQKNEQDAAAQAAELQQKQAEVDKLMAMSVSERTEAINAQYDGLIDTLQNDSKAQLDALKKSRRKEKKADKDRVTKAQKRLDEAIALPEEDVEEYVPKTFEDYLGGFKKGIKKKRVKYAEYEGLISEQKDLEQQLSSAKTTDERKDVRNRLLELNKRLSQMKKDMAERIVLDLSRTINNLQDELSTAVDNNDEDKVRSISQKLLNTIEDYKNISLKFGVNSSEGKSKDIKGMSAEKYAASVVGSNSKEKKAQAVASAQSSLESAKRSQQLHDEEYDQNVAAIKRNTQTETEYLNARRQSVLAVVDNNAELEKQLKINQGITSNEEDEELAAAREKRAKAREEEREKKRQEKLLGKEEKQKEKTNDQLQAEAYKARYSQTPTADGKSTLGEQENKKFDHIRKADEERRQRTREAREREIQEQYQDYIDQQQSQLDDRGTQDYGDEEYNPNYDLYDQLYNSEEQLAEYRQETANSTDQAIKAEKKVKPSSDDKDAIRLSLATSREDYINRVKLGLSRGYHIGLKGNETGWGESEEFLKKHGYKDLTESLKEDEANIAKIADTYYKPLGESTDQMKPSIDGVVDAEGKQIEANNGLTKSAEQAAEAVTKVFPNRPKSRESSDVSTMDLDTVVKELNTGATVKRRRSTSGKTKDLWDSYIKELQDRRHELLSEKKQQQEAKKKEEKASPKSPTKAKTQTGQGEQGITRLISPNYDLSKKTKPDELIAFDDKILEEQLRVVSELQNPSVKNNPKMKAVYEAYTKELTDFSLQVNEKLTAMGFEQTDEGWKMVLQTPDVKPQKDEKPSSKSQQSPKTKEAVQDGAFSYKYNGKVYPVASRDEKENIKGRILSSDDLSPLRNVGDTSKLKSRKANAIQRVKEALNAYSATGDKGILEELSKSFRGKYGKNKSLDLNIKEGVQAFISKELGELFVDPRSKQATLDSIKDVYSSGGKEGVRSALSKLTMSSLKKIADHIGYDEKSKGKLEDRFKTNKGVVDYLVGQTEKHYGKTQDQAKATQDAVKKETGTTGSADTSGLEKQKEKLKEVEEAADSASKAVEKLNDTTSGAASGSHKPNTTTTSALPVYGKNGTVVGASKRNNTPYTAEEFAANEGLAEKVLATASRATFYRGDYWEQSRANAQAYLDTLKEIKTEESKTDQSPISSDAEKMFYRNFNSKHGMFSNDPGGSFMTDSLQAIKEAYSYKDSLMSAQLKKNAKLLKVDVGGASYDEGISHIGNNDKLQALVTEYESIMSRLEKTGSSPYLYMGIDALDEEFDFSDDEKRVMELHQAIQIVNSDLQQMGAYQYEGLFELPDTKQFAQKAFNNGFDAVLFENITDQLGETMTELDNYNQILSNVLTVKDESVLTNIRDITNSAREMGIVLKGSLSEEEKLERMSNAIGSKRNSISNETPASSTTLLSQIDTATEKAETAKEAIEAEGKASADADTSGIEQQIGTLDKAEEKAEETKTAVIDLNNALESMKSILSSSGKEGLVDALSKLTTPNLRGILSNPENNLDVTKTSRLKKSGLIDRIVNGIESQMNAQPTTEGPSSAPNTSELEAKAEAYNHVAESAERAAEAEKNEQAIQADRESALQAVIDANEAVDTAKRQYTISSMPLMGKSADEINADAEKLRQAQEQLADQKAKFQSLFSSNDEMSGWLNSQRIGVDYKSIFGLTLAQAQSSAAALNQAAAAAENEAAKKREAADASKLHAAAEQMDADTTQNATNTVQNTSDAVVSATTSKRRRNKPSLTVKTDTALDTAVSQTAAQTTGDVSAETQAMQSAGEAAGQSAQQKQAFALANGQVASSANTTASAVMSEVQAFERILEVLQRIASLASSLKLDITINGLEGMDAEFMGKFESLKQAIDGIDPEKFNSIGTAFTGMKSAFSKFGEAGVSVFFNDLANGVRDFTNVLNETDISDNFTVIGNMINRISEAGKALNDAVTLLKSSGKEFRSTLGGNSYVNDSELNNQIEEQLKEWKYLSNPQNAVKSVKTQQKVADYQEAKANGAYAPAIEPGQVVWLQDYLDRAKASKDATDQLIADLNQLGDQGAPAIKALTDAQTQYMNNVALAQVAQQQYGEAMNKYADLVAQKETQLFGAISSEDKNRFQGVYSQMREEFERLKQELISGEKGVKEFDAAVSNLQKTWKQTISVGKGDIIGNFKGDIDSARGKISEYLKSNYKIVTEDVSGGRINSNNIAQFSAQVVDARNKVNDLRISWNTATGDIAVNSSQAANEFKGKFLSLFTDLQAKSKQLFIYWTATFFNPYRLIGTVKQVVNIVKQYDDALTEMRKVSDESVTSLKQFQVASFDMASSLGTTGLQIQKSTADWLRLGETLEEAQESARVSNLLLNVSEFQNVDSATQALVSASQAYKDLDKIEIVDKLNNIGNNFSVSTDQLATGLQNAAAVLMTQGNDIDEALALLTAGNAITQDISKTSAGIRTISLRISGTEEAKDEIRDMGEDIDDFVVRTRSKTDSIIRNYTAVASNNFEGVSVLDSNGNLRNTYDILLDIAKIYKEIQAEDKQNGTNRAQALVETLAGKTRSNIAASILQNPEMLEDVYKASQNSAGSAMEENLKYLDSISGKLQQLTNSAQKIANLVINSEGLKTILDIVNALVKGVADLTEKFGGLNIVIASILGIGAQMRGMSLFNYDKKKGFNFGIFEGILSGDKSLLQNRMANIMGDAMDLVPEDMLLKDIDNSIINGFSTQLQEQINLVQQAKGEMATFGDVIQNVQHPITGIGGALETAGGALAKFGTALLNIGVSLVATFAVQAIIGGITYILTYEDKLIEKGEEAKRAIADISSSFNEQTSSLNDIQVSLGVEVEEDQNTEDTISNIADKYSKLYSGVNGITNENINLTNDEYQQYLDLCNQLAGQYPSLVKGWDSQGNAILNIGKSADDARNALMSMYEAQKLSANVEIGNNLQNQYLGALTQSKRINKDLKKDRQRLDEIGDLSSYYTLDKSGVVTIRNEDFADVTNGISEVLGGYVISNKLSENESTGEITVQYILPDNLDDETMQSINAHVASAGRNALTNMTTERAELQQRVRAGELQNADLWASVRGSVSSYLSTSESFGKVNESIQSAVLGNLDKIDISNLGDYDTILDFIYGEIISSMDALNEDAQNKLAEAFTLDTSKINRKDYVVEINKMLSDVFGADASKWGKQLGFYDTFDELFAAENAIYAEFGDSLEDAERDAISSMSIDQLFKAKDLLGSNSYKTFQHLWADVIKQVTPKNEGVLSDLLGDENYKKTAEQYEQGISTVTSALETLRTQGRLTAEEMANLQEAFPDFFKSSDDFSLEHISDIGAKQFLDWVETIKRSMKTMTPEMQEAAQTYINNLADSFDFDISEEAMKDAVYSRVKSLGQGTYVSNVLANLQQKYGGNFDREIVFRLALNDELSGPMDEIYKKYDELAFNKRFDGISDKIKTLGQGLTNLQSEGQEMQNVISLRETKGIKTTVKNYNRLLKNNKEQVKNLKMQNALLKAQQTYVGKESDKWYEIKDQIDSNNSSIRDLINSQYEYGQNMSMAAITNTQGLLSQLRNAASKGHMDSSSLQELISMARGNADDILTTTTTGTYADPQAIRELYEEYGELGLQIVNTQMAAEQLDFTNNENEMLRLGKRIDPTIQNINDLHRAMAQNPDNPDYARIFDLDEENQGILQTITNLQSLEEEILANTSALGQYQTALNSANWSDPMQTIRGGMEDADKLYEQGWWGKDDFTSYANLIATNDQLQDKTGWAAIEAYETNREAVKRYLTEDVTGVDNWVDDMVSKSKELGEEWATLDEQGNYTFNVQDMEKFATAMGRSTEFAEYMLMAMKDANYDIDISRIDDEFSRTFNNISGTEANAAQQVKNLVTEMQNVALAGGDISQGAEAAGSALMRMREAGVSDDVIDSLVEELNLLGEFNGFHIDPKTLEVTTTVDTNEIDEVDENISKPRRLMVEYGVEEDSVKEAHNTIMSHWKGNEENIRYATKALSDYTAEELLAIKHNDGAWSDGEKEIEAFAETLGLPLDQVNALIIALEEMGMLKPEVSAEVNTDDAESKVETLREKLSKPFKAIVEATTQSEPIQNIKEKIQGKFQEGLSNLKLELQQKEAEKQYSSIVDATEKIPDAVSDASSNITSAISEGATTVANAINGGSNNGPGGTNGTPTYSSTTTGQPQHTGASSNTSRTANNGKGSSNNNGKSSGSSSVGTPIQSRPIDYSVLPSQQIVDVSYVPNVQQVENTNEEIEKNPVEQEVELVNKGNGSPFIGDQTTTVTTRTDTSGAMQGVQDLQRIQREMVGTAPTITPMFNLAEVYSGSKNATDSINRIPKSHNTNITATDNASGPAQRIRDIIAGIKDKAVSIVAKVSGESGVSNLATKIAGLASKTVNVVSNFITNTIHNKLGFGGGTAYSSGTTLGHGYANGTAQDWTVGKDEEALTNEVGQESIVIFCDDIR